MEENKILQSLLQDVQMADDARPEVNNNNDELFNMIEKYRNHVKQQKNSCGNEKKSNINHRQRNRFGVTLNKTFDTGKSLMSHSQPCLYSVDNQPKSSANNVLHHVHLSDPREDINNVQSDQNGDGNGDTQESLFDDVMPLKNEITGLKRQIQYLERKSNKLKQLESAYSRIEQEFQQIIDQHDKHEQLERTAILQLEQQIQRLHQHNQVLVNENEMLNRVLEQNRKSGMDRSPTEPAHEAPGFTSSPLEKDYAKEMVYMKKHLDDVIEKNKELLIIEERQGIELDAQRTTLEEQRTHIDVLEKALTNAQERLLAKDRQAMDAVAVMEKCAHLQKLLQESLDEKQKRQEEHSKQKTQLEMELTKLQFFKKEASSFESRIKSEAKSPDSEEIAKLKKTIHARDERICQLESNLLSIQQLYDDELKRNNAKNTDVEVLRERVRSVEEENADKEQRIENLLNEKQRIHCQWAEERRSLDHRVRVLEQDLRVLMTESNGALPAAENFSNSYYASPLNLHNRGHYIQNVYRPLPVYHSTGLQASNFVGSHGNHFNPMTTYSCSRSNSIGEEVLNGPSSRSANASRGSTSDVSNNGRSVLTHDSTMARMEELRRKIADRRAITASSAISSGVPAVGLLSPAGKYEQNSSIGPHSFFDNTDGSYRRSTKANVGENSPRDSTSGSNSAVRSPSRMSSHMPENLSMDSLPPAARRRFIASENIAYRSNHNTPLTNIENRRSGASDHNVTIINPTTAVATRRNSGVTSVSIKVGKAAVNN